VRREYKAPLEKGAVGQRRSDNRSPSRFDFLTPERASPPALPPLARVRLQRLSPIGNCRNRPAAAENAANFFRSSARAGGREAERRLFDRPRQSPRKQSRAVEVRKGKAVLGEMDSRHADPNSPMA